MPSGLQISFSLPAVSICRSLDSTTQGPAMRNRGLSSPTSNPQSFTLQRPPSGSRRDHRQSSAGPLRGRAVLERRGDVRLEQGMAGARRRGELRVELHPDKEALAGQLHDLGQVLARRARGNLVALGLELRHVDVVDLVAMPMSFIYFRSVNRRSERPRFDPAFLRAQAHGAAELRLVGALLD